MKQPNAPDLEAVAARAKDEWARDALLRAEFASEDDYVALRKAEARGSLRVLAPGAALRPRVVPSQG